MKVEEGCTTLEVVNTGRALAFMVEVRVEDERGKSLRPVFFSDNYFALLPGERKVLTVEHPTHPFAWKVGGWNMTSVRPH